jgi:hypothetical protein
VDPATVMARRTVQFPSTAMTTGIVDPMAVTVGRTTWFPSAVVTTGWRGPGIGDGQVDDVVAGHGGDGVGSGRGGGGVALIVEEERDDIVPGCGGEVRDKGAVLGHGDGVEAVGVAVAWTQRCRRACRKFWQPDGVQVKIFRLGFKDRAAGGFIGGQQ